MAEKTAVPATLDPQLAASAALKRKRQEAAKAEDKDFEREGLELPEQRPVAKAPSDVNFIVSPLERSAVNNGLRPRANWHQTWKRDDEFDEARETGYRVIRKSKSSMKEAAGEETGEVLKRSSDDGTDIAMELPMWVYEDHLAAIAVKSHSPYTDKNFILNEFSKGLNRDMSSKKEQVHLKAVEYEPQVEELHPGRRL